MKRLLFSLGLIICSSHALDIAVIGVGYVGLNTGVGLASLGHHVTCADIDEARIAQLKYGECPFFEPGLSERMYQCHARLKFTTDLETAIRSAQIICVAVGTPPHSDGSADLFAVMHVAQTIGQNLNTKKIVLMRSTVPMEAHEEIESCIARHKADDVEFVYASHPEFLREGTAQFDFMHPHFVLFGTTHKDEIKALVKPLYQSIITPETPVLVTDVKAAALVKYVINTFLATKISFINGIANLCDALGIDVELVTQAIKHDPRIGGLFLKPGPGYGGSCLPKDSAALLNVAQRHAVDLPVLAGAVQANEAQPYQVVHTLCQALGTLHNKRIALWGVTFKAGTDDVRGSAAIPIIAELLEHGAQVCAYDPQGQENMKKIYPNIQYADSAETAAHEADAICIITEWPEFKTVDYPRILKTMRTPVIVDTRNVIPQSVAQQLASKKFGVEAKIFGLGTTCRY